MDGTLKRKEYFYNCCLFRIIKNYTIKSTLSVPQLYYKTSDLVQHFAHFFPLLDLVTSNSNVLFASLFALSPPETHVTCHCINVSLLKADFV